MRTSIFLAGFMGCGKTSVGKHLAADLNYIFVDIDDQIISSTKKSISEIFNDFGEQVFRQYEQKVLINTINCNTSSVVALGGGTFINEKNRKLIARSGISIWLDVPFDLIVSRLEKNTDRPLFKNLDAALKLYEQRLNIYKHADIQIYIENMSIENILVQIHIRLKEYLNFHYQLS